MPLPNPAKLAVNNATVVAVAYGGLQAIVQLDTSYGPIRICAGVAHDQIKRAVAAGVNNVQAQGEVWTQGEGDDWCPKLLRRYGTESTLALLESPAIKAWRAWEPGDETETVAASVPSVPVTAPLPSRSLGGGGRPKTPAPEPVPEPEPESEPAPRILGQPQPE